MRRSRKLDKIGEAGRKSEKAAAKRLKGRLTGASGASAGDKGDIDLPSMLLECKSTKADSLPIKREWLIKITQEAVMKGKKPALAISFTNEAGRPHVDGSWVAIPESLFREVFGD